MLELEVLDLVNSIRIKMRRYGTRKVYLDIKSELVKRGLKVGRDKLFKILRERGLLIKPKKKYKTTTDSKHHFRKYKNELKAIDLSSPEQVFVSDITYVNVKGKHGYLFLITDAYSKKIMGWHINTRMKAEDGLVALKMATKNKIYERETIHHSDRGIQYCSSSYVSYELKNNYRPSMTEDLHVYENGIAERLNGILKGEFDIDIGYGSLSEARREIGRSIDLYNNERRHESLHMQTPEEVHRNPGMKIKSWPSRRRYQKEKVENLLT